MAGLGGSLAFCLGVQFGSEQYRQARQVEPEDEDHQSGERASLRRYGLVGRAPATFAIQRRHARFHRPTGERDLHHARP
jgi:hypothetical protein